MKRGPRPLPSTRVSMVLARRSNHDGRYGATGSVAGRAAVIVGLPAEGR